MSAAADDLTAGDLGRTVTVTAGDTNVSGPLNGFRHVLVKAYGTPYVSTRLWIGSADVKVRGNTPLTFTSP